MASRDTFERKTFTTSRLAEFATENELTKQVGHGAWLWPLVVVKELVDNALDAAERAGIAPDITVTVDADAIVVDRQWPGHSSRYRQEARQLRRQDLVERRLCGADPRAAGQRAAVILPMGYVLDGRRARSLSRPTGAPIISNSPSIPSAGRRTVDDPIRAVSGKNRDPRHGALAEFTKVGDP